MEESKSIIDELEKEALALADSRSKEAILIALNKINNISDPEVLELFSKARNLIREYINLKVLLTKAKVEEVKKLNEKLAKLEKAFSLAVDQNDFSKVKEEAKKG